MSNLINITFRISDINLKWTENNAKNRWDSIFKNYMVVKLNNVDKPVWFDKIDLLFNENNKFDNNIDEKFDIINKKFDIINKKFDEIDEKLNNNKKFDIINKKFDEIDEKLNNDEKFDEIDEKLNNDEKFDEINKIIKRPYENDDKIYKYKREKLYINTRIKLIECGFKNQDLENELQLLFNNDSILINFNDLDEKLI